MSTHRILSALLVCCVSSTGCLDDPRDERPDVSSPDAEAVDVETPDAVDPDVGPADPTEPAPASCEEALDHYRTGADAPLACADWAAPCEAPLDRCCTATLTCVGGVVERALDCVDDIPAGDCGRACALHTLDDCALDPACAPFVLAGCGPAPEGVIEGPSCAPRRGEVCQDDGACGEGQRCQAFWIDSCAGADCDACGGEARYCVDAAE